MKKFFLFVYLLPVLLLGGCVFSNYPMQVQHVGKIDKDNKSITFLNQTYFTPNLIDSLLRHGFTIKPTPIQYSENDVLSSKKIISFSKASARYGLTTYIRPSNVKCVLSGNEMVKATLTVTDLQSGNIVLTIQQEGADDSCPPIPPIWDGLAEALAENWH